MHTKTKMTAKPSAEEQFLDILLCDGKTRG